jgi:ABC-type transport system involved in multi-copper enzyme maturation permease subunit
MNWTIIKNSFRKFYFQPSILIVMVAEAFFIFLFIFMVRLLYQDGMLVGVTILGSGEEMPSGIFIQSMVSSTVGLLSQIVMFLFILGGSTHFSELWMDPLLGITLTKPFSRMKFIMSHFAGAALAVLVNLLLFIALISLILFAKSEGALFYFPLWGVLSMWVQFLFILALAALLSLLLESSMAVMVINVALFYILAPFASIPTGENLFLKFLLYHAIPVGRLWHTLNGLFLGGKFSPFDLLPVITISVVYFSSAIILFKRKDIH